jgi:Fe-S cluster assembly ATP-binding protein
VPAGQTHAIMGPNGAGKSTLAYALSGRDGYEVTGGDSDARTAWICCRLEPEARAAAGLFLSFQYPVEIPGLSAIAFLKARFERAAQERAAKTLCPRPSLLKLLRAKAEALKIDQDMLKRPLNVGFSGGEKKRFEALQIAVLEPKFAIWMKRILVSISMR